MCNQLCDDFLSWVEMKLAILPELWNETYFCEGISSFVAYIRSLCFTPSQMDRSLILRKKNKKCNEKAIFHYQISGVRNEERNIGKETATSPRCSNQKNLCTFFINLSLSFPDAISLGLHFKAYNRNLSTTETGKFWAHFQANKNFLIISQIWFQLSFFHILSLLLHLQGINLLKLLLCYQ